MNTRELLAARDWLALKDRFLSTPPATAEEFQARALMAINTQAPPFDWRPIIGDLRRACDLQPADPLLHANLAQALLDAGLPADARRAAQSACDLDARTLAGLEKLASACVALGDWEPALDALRRAQAIAGRELPPAAARLRHLLESRWWQPLKVDGMTLRTPAAQDKAFLAATFVDERFMRQFHRMQATGASGVASYIHTGAQLPLLTRRIDWIVADHERPIGLAGIVDIDWGNRRGELLVGLPGEAGFAQALKATASVLDFAFRRLALDKLVSYVYADNPWAQSNTLHLGFRQEGLLRSHIVSEGQRIDLYANGMLRGEYEASPLFSALRRRWRRDIDAATSYAAGAPSV